VGDSTPHAIAGVSEYDLIRLWVIGEFSLYNNAKAAQFKKDIGPMFPVNLNCLGIRSNTEAGYKHCELCVYDFFTIAIV
jgi:hypothetical protein